jgi:hypothetical protein
MLGARVDVGHGCEPSKASSGKMGEDINAMTGMEGTVPKMER